jgi:hypothetical protein
MGTNCPPLLVKLFLHAYEEDFRQGLLKNNDRKLVQTFNSSFHYIDDLLSPALCAIGHSRACAQYSNFIDQAQLLMQKLGRQGYVRA